MRKHLPIVVVVLVLLACGLWNTRVESYAERTRPGPTTPAPEVLMAGKANHPSPSPDSLGPPPHILIPASYWAQLDQKEVIFLDDGQGHILWRGTPKQFRERIDTLNAVAARMGSKDTIDLVGRDVAVELEAPPEGVDGQDHLSDLLQGK